MVILRKMLSCLMFIGVRICKKLVKMAENFKLFYYIKTLNNNDYNVLYIKIKFLKNLLIERIFLIVVQSLERSSTSVIAVLFSGQVRRNWTRPLHWKIISVTRPHDTRSELVRSPRFVFNWILRGRSVNHRLWIRVHGHQKKSNVSFGTKQPCPYNLLVRWARSPESKIKL